MSVVAASTRPTSSSPISALASTGPVASTTGATSAGGDLISQIDVNRNAIKGEWTIRGTGLVSRRTAKARIDLPVSLPQEYDFEFSVTRVSGSGELVVGFVREGVQSTVYNGRTGYMTGINGMKRTLSSKSLSRRSKPVSLKFEVRCEVLTLYANGKKAFSTQSPAEIPPTPNDWKVCNDFGLFLGSDLSMIRNITVKPAPSS